MTVDAIIQAVDTTPASYNDVHANIGAWKALKRSVEDIIQAVGAMGASYIAVHSSFMSRT